MFAMRSIMVAIRDLGGEIPPGTDEYWPLVYNLSNFNSTKLKNEYEDLSSYSSDYTFTQLNLPASVVNFSPFSNTSLYLNGSSSYATVTVDSSFAFGTSDFTIEMWFNVVNPGTGPSIGSTLISNCTTGSDVNYFQLVYTSAMKLGFVARNSTTNIPITGNTTITYGVWHHVAVVRSGGVFYIYLDGALEMQQTSAVSITQRNLIIGGFLFTSSNSFTKGHIYQVHVTDNAKYTAAFTPSAAEITPSANTILLTAFGPVLKDLSSKNLTITKSFTDGKVCMSPEIPPGAPKLDNTNSVFVYNRSPVSQNIKIETTTNNFIPSTSSTQWTLECFVYLTRTPNGSAVLSNYSAQSNGVPMMLSFGTTIGGRLTTGRYLSGWVTASSTAAVPLFTWLHIAGTFDGSVHRVFLNGQLMATSIATTAATVGDTNFSIGRRWDTSNEGLEGYIYNPRVSMGIARYTASFTPPTEPVTSDSFTRLLFNPKTAVLPDYKNLGTGSTITGSGQYEESKWKNNGLKYLYSATTPSYAIINTNPCSSFGLSDFTIEFWLKRNTVSTVNTVLLDGRTYTTSAGTFDLSYTNNNLIFRTENTARITTTTSPLSTNWQHIAISRSSGTTRLFVDGAEVGSFADAMNYLFYNGFTVGYSYNGSAPASTSGIIEDLRITRGLGRYTANFSVPTAPFYFEV